MTPEGGINNLNKYEHENRQFFHLIDDIEKTGTFVEDIYRTMHFFRQRDNSRAYVRYDYDSDTYFIIDIDGYEVDVYYNPESNRFFSNNDESFYDMTIGYEDGDGSYVLNSRSEALAVATQEGDFFINYDNAYESYYCPTPSGIIELIPSFSSVNGIKFFIDKHSGKPVETIPVDVGLEVERYIPTLSEVYIQREQLHEPSIQRPIYRRAPQQPTQIPNRNVLPAIPSKGRERVNRFKTQVMIAILMFGVGFALYSNRGEFDLSRLTDEPTYTVIDSTPESGTPESSTPEATSSSNGTEVGCVLGNLMISKHPVVPDKFVLSNTTNPAHVGSDFGAPRIIDTEDEDKDGDFTEELRSADQETAGQPVYAATDGKVLYARGDFTGPVEVNGYQYSEVTPELDQIWSGYGNVIVLEHMNGQRTIYVHLQPASVQVSVGDCVKGGQQIAGVGHSGDAMGDHLHYEERIDPNCKDYSQICVNNNNLAPIK